MSSGQDDVDSTFVPETLSRREISPVSATQLTRCHHQICGGPVPKLGMTDAELNSFRPACKGLQWEGD